MDPIASRKFPAESGADKEKLSNGETALHRAATNGHLEVVRLLLESGSDKETTSHLGKTALHSAAENDNLEVVRLLLDSGADKERLTLNGETALQLAAENEHDDVVHLLQTFSPLQRQRCSSN